MADSDTQNDDTDNSGVTVETTGDVNIDNSTDTSADLDDTDAEVEGDDDDASEDGDDADDGDD